MSGVNCGNIGLEGIGLYAVECARSSRASGVAIAMAVTARCAAPCGVAGDAGISKGVRKPTPQTT